MTNYFRTHLPKLVTLAALLIVPSACLLQAASVTPAGTAPLSETDTKHVAAQTNPQAPINPAQKLLEQAVYCMAGADAEQASEAVQKAITNGADIGSKISVGWGRAGDEPTHCWPLQAAVFGGQIKCVALLLDAGAPVAVPGPNNKLPESLKAAFPERTPLELAATVYDQAYNNYAAFTSFYPDHPERDYGLWRAKTLFKIILHAHAPTSTEAPNFPYQYFDRSLLNVLLEVAHEKDARQQAHTETQALLLKQSPAFKDLYPIIQGYAQQRFVDYLEEQEKQAPRG